MYYEEIDDFKTLSAMPVLSVFPYYPRDKIPSKSDFG